MKKLAPRGPFRIIWGIFGYIVATVFILGISLLARRGESPVVRQKVAIFCLLLLASTFGSLYFAIRQRRNTYHEYWRKETKYLRDIGPGEQKCGQLAIIMAITAWVIYIDMWL